MPNKILILIFASILFACGSGNAQNKDIILYGSDNCQHCVDFKAKLDSVGYKYEFREVEFDEAMFNEMVSKVRRAGIGGGFKYPVLDIEGNILIAPELNEVIELM